MDNLHNVNIAASQNSRERDYWLAKLDGVQNKTSFPTDRLLSEDHKNMDTLSFSVPETVVSSLNKIANGSQVRLFAILTTNLMTLLYKYTSSRDLSVCTPIYRQDIEGNFMNTVLIIREILEESVSYKQQLLKTAKTIYEANENLNYPIESLLYQIDKLTASGENLLFDIGILLTNIHEKEYLNRMNLNLIFSFTEKENGLEGTLEFNSCLYEKASMLALMEHYINLLERGLSQLDFPVEQLEMIGEQERKKLLYQWNATEIGHNLNGGLVELFEETARKNPDHIAVKYKGESYRYCDLNKKANRLARTIKKTKRKQNSIVGLFMDRSYSMAVSILAVLKAGMAYLPIDPEYPADRILFMLKDSEVSVLLTDKDRLENFDYDGELIKVGREESYEEEDTDLNQTYSLESLTYIIYTSGSSGVPKGVMVKQKNVLHYLNSFLQEFIITEKDRVIQVSSYSFDAFVEEFYPALIRGGTLIIPENEIIMDVRALVSFINQHGGTFMSCSPLLLNEINSLETKTSIRTFISGGDVLKTEYIDYLQKHSQVYNTYGPTETTVCASYYKCTSDQLRKYVPIGKPIGNYKIYILDQNCNITPVNVPGQLCIGGGGLTEGYLKREELTEEKFIPNPYIPEEKIYLTGDLARWLPDGNIEFLDRMDSQIKIRGYRIELEEIQTVLMSYPSVKDAIVILREDKTDDKYLCGYVISDGTADSSQIKNYMASKLPYYMIPAYIMELKKLPVNVHGKLDMNGLPDPKAMGANEDLQAPTDPLEVKLMQIWIEVLGLNDTEISSNVDFFDLGGHSLKATRMMLRIFKDFNVQLPVSVIFENPTIKQLANYIRKSDKSSHWSIVPAETRDFYPLSSAQKRIFIMNRMQKENVNYNMTKAMRIEGELDFQRFEEAWKEIIQRHEAFRTSFCFHGDEPVQIIHDDVPFSIRYREENGQSTEELIAEFITPLDISKAPILDIQLIGRKDGTHLLLFKMHHIIADGMSVDILIRDFMRLYRKEELEPVKLQYKDYAVWQNSRQKDTYLKQEKYWLEQFSGSIPDIDFPRDFYDHSTECADGGRVWFDLDCEIYDKLNTLADQTSSTAFMILMSAYSILLSKYTVEEDIVVGTPFLGRLHSDLESTIGMFVNILPIRSKPNGRKMYIDFLREIKQTILNAQVNQEYQLQDLIEKLQIDRGNASNPLMRYLFSLENFEITDDFEFDQLKFTDIKFDPESTKSDISLLAIETDYGMRFEIEYLPILFKKETIEKLGANYISLLKQITDNPQITLEELIIQHTWYAMEEQQDEGDFVF